MKRPITARGRGETLEDALGEAYLALGIEQPDDDQSSYTEDWSSGVCEVVLTVTGSNAAQAQQVSHERLFTDHAIRSRVEAEHFGSWLLMKVHPDGGWSSEFWCRITAADGLLRVSGDFAPIVFQGHLSLTDDPISRVAWMGSHEGLDHYVIEKARTGSGSDACTHYDVEQARDDLRELIEERTCELEDEARDEYGDDRSEWPGDWLNCSSIPAMQDGVDATAEFSGREGVHEIVCAVWGSDHAIDSEHFAYIGESPSSDLRLAHAAVKRLHALLSAERVEAPATRTDTSTGLLVVSAPLTHDGVRTYEMDDS
jgi:hypothetical protein